MTTTPKRNDQQALRIGAVAYDPKVITIWEGFKGYFDRQGVPIDYILYSSYDAQVEAQLAGQIDVAWNSPLAWVKTAMEAHGRCRAVAMRDTDCDLSTVILVRKNSGLKTVADLRNRTIAVGALDSPQATLIPLSMIADSGVVPGKDCTVLYHNVAVGKHGDHVGGERDAARALAAGKADAACALDRNYMMFVKEGTLDPGVTEVLTATPAFDHCNFTALAELPEQRVQPFVNLLLSMSFDDPAVRTFMELEGLKRWLVGRTTGYKQLETAVKRFNFYA
jgi:phosphonate transport system substrate-binding protein